MKLSQTQLKKHLESRLYGTMTGSWDADFIGADHSRLQSSSLLRMTDGVYDVIKPRGSGVENEGRIIQSGKTFSAIFLRISVRGRK